MLKDKNINVSISYRNISHYRKLGYNPIINKDLSIEIEDLSNGSHVLITAICDLCKIENNIKYHKYIDNKERHGFYGCKKCSRQKASLTMLDKYGVSNVSELNECKTKRANTCMERYGYKTNLISPESKKENEKILLDKYGTDKWYKIRSGNGGNNTKDRLVIFAESLEFSKPNFDNVYVDISTEDYHLYRNEVRRITKNNYKVILDSWDGKDYYDEEYIKEYYVLDSNDPKYPTIDHKISIYHGFSNNIPVEEIADISNLCITKRSINCSKNSLIEENFILK